MKRLSALLFLLMILLSAASAQQLELNIQSCIELALENNPDLKTAGINLRTAEREMNSSWNNFLPSISAGAGISASTPVFSDSINFRLGFSGSLSLSLSLNPGIRNTIESIRLSYDSQEITLQAAEKQLKSSIEKEFYYLITSKSNLEIVTANMELAKKNYEQAQTNYSYGRSSELAVLQAQVNAANLEPQYKQAIAAYNSRLNDFRLVLGLKPDAKITLDGSLETKKVNFDAEKLAEIYIDNRSDIISLRKNLEILNNNKTLASFSNYSPTVRLSGGYSATGSQSWSDSFSVGINLSVPIDNYIPGSSASVSMAEIDDRIEKAEISLEQAINEAKNEIYNLSAQLDTAAANMELSEINITLAKKSYEMSEQSFARGSVQRLDVEDAQQSYLEAKQQYLSSQYNYLTGLIALRDALGLESLDELYSTGEANE